MKQGKVIRVSGPLVVATGLAGTRMYEMVRVGELRLFGEVIEVRGDEYSIQVYEETEGVGPGAPVFPTGEPLSVELGPGLIAGIYDGVQRPLDVLSAQHGDYIVRGAESDALDRAKKWRFVPKVEAGARVASGDVLGTVRESAVVEHRIMVPHGISGKVAEIREVEATIEEVIARIETDDGVKDITMLQKWPVRRGRPTARKLAPKVPLVTGQRVLDTFFPITKGGTACVPGPFGSGKTVVQHQLAKWADAQIIVYVGCGERGNEMTDVLLEFPELLDPNTGEPLMQRTVLVANTSNMPVAAREASVFTGITMAEYYRDMGYDVALMADSTSRWAEAMREMSGRLEEMPGEEGFPAYLASRIAAFYERSGRVVCQASEEREGSLSIIGAVSPPGGDLSEPVVQSTLRVVKVFWGLDAELAYSRHFPAINWLTSYSLYLDTVDNHCNENVNENWSAVRGEAMTILQREAGLEELVRLVGMDTLAAEDRLLMHVARMIREDFLHQNAFVDIDTYTSLEKQHKMLGLIICYYQKAQEVMAAGAALADITAISAQEAIGRAKMIPEDQIARFDEVRQQIERELDALAKAEVNQP
ncbi:MAG: V-type ATP synthase subunit A [Planctomycetes bacterium]|jgi:V/A-type H+-transporting ATPase subunit A|nr:V-type ATP synthase subunit A [Planctomycetota bacterium]